MELRDILRWFFDPWIILGALGFGVGLLVATLFLLYVTRQPQIPAAFPTAALTVVPAPTFTPIPPTPLPTQPVTPTSSLIPTPPGGDFAIGAYVQITGTGGDGLRLRVEPGLSSEIRYLGLEAEVFQIREGPQDADEFTWWYLVAPFDEARSGWAVSNYLMVVQNP